MWELAEGLIECRSLKLLDLKGNSLEQEGVEAVGDLIQELPHLTSVNLANTELDEAGGLALAECITRMKVEVRKANSPLEIDLRSNQLGYSLESLDVALRTNERDIRFKFPVHRVDAGFGR